MGRAGPEHPAQNSTRGPEASNPKFLRTRDSTPDAREGTSDPDLVELISRWPDLHEATRLRILAIVREDFDPEDY